MNETISAMKKRTLAIAALLLLMPALSACTTTEPAGPVGENKPVTKPSDGLFSQGSSNILYGDVRDDLDTIAAQYKSNKTNPMLAARYGKALREAGQLKAAKSTLTPLSESKQVATLANTELSAIYLSEADFGRAESFARKAIKADAKNYRAWRNLGNALDAQEKYKDGESAFRKALELWATDDKVPIMNNLALNLAAQGYTDQALTMLYDAQKIDPDRAEIERNIRIIRTLNEPAEYKGVKKPLPANKLTTQ